MMLVSIPTKNNVFFTADIKVDSANPALQHIEAWKSAAGHFVFSAEKGTHIAFKPSPPYHRNLSDDMLGDPAAEVLLTRPPLTDYQSEAALDLILRWTSECVRSHAQCEPICAKPLPRRLIDVGSTSQDPSLVVPEPDTLGLYVALSYCWGLGQPVTLKGAMLEDGLPSFPIDKLPATLRDAIVICRKLGYQYIWIDAFCIIQDSPDGADWNIESGMMDRVYSNATITIAASAAKEAGEGILQRFPKPRSITLNQNLIHSDSCAVPFHLEDGRVGKASIYFHPHEINTHQPLNTRAWTLKESLLSPRILSYQSNQLVWKCKKGRICANTPSDIIYQSVDSLKWNDIVYQFTSRSMTVSSDRLAALSGYAKSVYLKSEASKINETQQRHYLAGLWSDSILDDLMWRCSYPWKYRPATYRAPSWSWASNDSHVHFVDRVPASCSNVNILDVSLAVSGLNPFGSLKPSPPSYIKLRGHIKRVAGLPVELRRMQQLPVSEFTVDCYQGLVGESQGHNKFGVSLDTLETAQEIVYHFQRVPGNSIIFSNSCPLRFLKMTDTQALIVEPTLNDELLVNEHVFRRVGILTAIYQTLGGFGTWFDDVEEPAVITLL
jgi:hypothetical protein